MSRFEGFHEGSRRTVRGKRQMVDVAIMMAENSLIVPPPRQNRSWQPARRHRRRSFVGTPSFHRRIKI